MPKRQLPPTPQTPRKMSAKKGGVSFKYSVPAKLVKYAKFAPYVGPSVAAAQRVYRGYKASRALFKKFKPAPTKRMSKGATLSKSAGYFKSSGLKSNKFDKFLNNGVVLHREHGNVITDSTRNAVYVAHSTCPKRTILRAAVASLLKLLFKKAGIKIKNFDLPILVGANIPARIEFQWKEYDGTILYTQAFPMTVTKTLTQMVDDIQIWLGTFTAEVFPQQWNRVTYYHDIGTIGSSRLLAYDIDLTSTTVEFLCSSHMKIQNRTVNTAANDQADDVDNVPIYGRSYDTQFNGTTFRDYNQPLSNGNPQLRTEIDFGVLDYTVSAPVTGSTLYDEVALPNQMVGLTSSGKAHLDPGEIKTSVLNYSTTMPFNKIITLYKAKSLSPGVIFYMGNTRIFGFEKMITAVATSVENQYKLAIETDLKVGAICRTRDNHQTAMQTGLKIGPP